WLFLPNHIRSMKRLKERWEIQKNWQLLFPILGAGLNLLACYIVSRGILSLFGLEGSGYFWYYAAALSIVGHFVMLRFFFWCFKKLENKWRVDHKWEMIAIFIVFAITGSLSGKDRKSTRLNSSHVKISYAVFCLKKKIKKKKEITGWRNKCSSTKISLTSA